MVQGHQLTHLLPLTLLITHSRLTGIWLWGALPSNSCFLLTFCSYNSVCLSRKEPTNFQAIAFQTPFAFGQLCALWATIIPRISCKQFSQMMHKPEVPLELVIFVHSKPLLGGHTKALINSSIMDIHNNYRWICYILQIMFPFDRWRAQASCSDNCQIWTWN